MIKLIKCLAIISIIGITHRSSGSRSNCRSSLLGILRIIAIENRCIETSSAHLLQIILIFATTIIKINKNLIK